MTHDRFTLRDGELVYLSRERRTRSHVHKRLYKRAIQMIRNKVMPDLRKKLDLEGI